MKTKLYNILSTLEVMNLSLLLSLTGVLLFMIIFSIGYYESFDVFYSCVALIGTQIFIELCLAITKPEEVDEEKRERA